MKRDDPCDREQTANFFPVVEGRKALSPAG